MPRTKTEMDALPDMPGQRPPDGSDLNHGQPRDPLPDQSNAGGKPAAPAKTRREPDKELQDMAKIDRILSEHDEQAQARVLSWIIQRRGTITRAHTTISRDTTGQP